MPFPWEGILLEASVTLGIGVQVIDEVLWREVQGLGRWWFPSTSNCLPLLCEEVNCVLALEADTTRRGPKGGGSSCPPEIKLQLLLPVEGGVCFLLLNVPSEASARWDDSAMGVFKSSMFSCRLGSSSTSTTSSQSSWLRSIRLSAWGLSSLRIPILSPTPYSVCHGYRCLPWFPWSSFPGIDAGPWGTPTGKHSLGQTL